MTNVMQFLTTPEMCHKLAVSKQFSEYIEYWPNWKLQIQTLDKQIPNITALDIQNDQRINDLDGPRTVCINRWKVH